MTCVKANRTPEFRGTSLSVVYPWSSSPKPADLGFLTSFATSLSSLWGEFAVDANPADPSRYGLDRPSWELLLKDAAANSLHVMVGKQDGEVLFLAFEGDPMVYAGDPELLTLLEVDPFAFVNKYAAIVKLDHVDSLTISGGGKRHVLSIRRAIPGSEDGAAWLVDGQAVDEKAFKDFYTNAVALKIDSLHDGPVTGAPDMQMVFALNTGAAKTFTVDFVPYSQEFYAVVKSGGSDTLVNRQQVKMLLQSLEELAKAAGG